MRILAGIIMIGIGALALYPIVSKQYLPLSQERFERAIEEPRIVARTIRGTLGMLFIALGAIAILKGLSLMP